MRIKKLFVGMLVLLFSLPIFSSQESEAVTHDFKEVISRIYDLPKDLQNLVSKKADLLYHKQTNCIAVHSAENHDFTHVDYDKNRNLLAWTSRSTEGDSIVGIYNLKSGQSGRGAIDIKVDRMQLDMMSDSVSVYDDRGYSRFFSFNSHNQPRDTDTACSDQSDRTDIDARFRYHHIEKCGNQGDYFLIYDNLAKNTKFVQLKQGDEIKYRIFDHSGPVTHVFKNKKDILIFGKDAVFVVNFESDFIARARLVFSSCLKTRKVAISNAADNSVYVYNANDHKLLKKIENFAGGVYLAFTRKDNLVAISQEGEISVWIKDFKEKEYSGSFLPKIMEGQSLKVKKVSTDGTEIVALAEDNKKCYVFAFARYLSEILEEFEKEAV